MSPEQLDELQRLPELNVKIADESIIAIAQLAKELKVSSLTIKAALDNQGIVPGVYQFTTTRGNGLTIDEAKIVRENITPPMPEGYMRPQEVADYLGIHAQTLNRWVGQAGWQLPWYKSKGRHGKKGQALSPEQIAQLRQRRDR